MRNDFETDMIAALPKLRRYGLSLCRRSDIADDLVQTTVERALRNSQQFKTGTNMDAWLFRILRNAWIDITRRTATRSTELDITEMPEAAVHDGTRDVETIMMLRKTEEALADLPEEQREIVNLVCFEELSYAEAAEILDIPKGTVMSRLARGRVALAKKVGIE